METIEILIYLGIAILVGALIMGFIQGWDYKSSFKDMKKLAMDEEDGEFEKVEPNAFAGKLQTVFKECTSRGENMSARYYLEGEGFFNKSHLFDIYKDLGWCEIIQSANESCGAREDLIMQPIELPKVIRVNCTSDRLYIK